MNDDFQKLIEISDHRKRLEAMLKKQKQDFMDSLALQQAQLEDLENEERKLREEILLEFEKQKQTIQKVGDRNIIKQVKKTLKIVDADKLKDSMLNKIDTIEQLIDTEKEIGDTIKEDLFDEQVIIKDKKTVNDIIDRFQKVEGEILNGVELQETKYLLIK